MHNALHNTDVPNGLPIACYPLEWLCCIAMRVPSAKTEARSVQNIWSRMRLGKGTWLPNSARANPEKHNYKRLNDKTLTKLYIALES